MTINGARFRENPGREAADKLRNNRNAAEFMHVIVGIKKTRNQFDDLKKTNETNIRLTHEKNNKRINT